MDISIYILIYIYLNIIIMIPIIIITSTIITNIIHNGLLIPRRIGVVINTDSAVPLSISTSLITISTDW